MKKLFTIALLMVAVMVAHSQYADFTPLNPLRAVSHNSLPARPNPSTGLRAGAHQIALDYDSFDRKWAAQHTPPDSMYEYEWNINSHNDTAATFSLRTAIQTYDTLMDVNNNFLGYSHAGNTVRVDSFLLFVADSNASGINDTFIVTVFDKNVATATSGFTGGLSAVGLWADTIIVNSNIFPDGQNFYGVNFKPNVTLPAGHTFGIKVDFKGPVADQLFVLASYRDHCGNSNIDAADTNMVASHNSSFYLNFGAGSGFYDYSAPSVFYNTGNSCGYFFIQNFLFYPFLTLTPTTGIESIDAGISNFSVYPNPSNGVFTSSMKLETASDVTTTIVDLTGNKIYESTDKAVTEMEKTINLSTIAAGMYIVNVKTATGSVNQRIVIK